jgi:hypothetical protein
MRPKTFVFWIFLVVMVGFLAYGCGTTRQVTGNSGPVLPQTTDPNTNYGLFTVSSNVGSDDLIIGSVGAVEGGSLIKIYDDQLSILPYSITASSNGSFSLAIGDNNAPFYFHLTATASGKSESVPAFFIGL